MGPLDLVLCHDGTCELLVEGVVHEVAHAVFVRRLLNLNFLKNIISSGGISRTDHARLFGGSKIQLFEFIFGDWLCMGLINVLILHLVNTLITC